MKPPTTITARKKNSYTSKNNRTTRPTTTKKKPFRYKEKEYIKPQVPTFSMERLQKESEIVQNMFVALQIMKLGRIKTQHQNSETQRKNIEFRMEKEQEIVTLKKTYNNKIFHITKEYSSFKKDSERKINEIREKLKI